MEYCQANEQLFLHAILAKEIVEAIEKCKTLKTLKLEGNTLGVDSAKAISKALEKHPEFEVKRIVLTNFSVDL